MAMPTLQHPASKQVWEEFLPLNEASNASQGGNTGWFIINLENIYVCVIMMCFVASIAIFLAILRYFYYFGIILICHTIWFKNQQVQIQKLLKNVRMSEWKIKKISKKKSGKMGIFTKISLQLQSHFRSVLISSAQLSVTLEPVGRNHYICQDSPCRWE